MTPHPGNARVRPCSNALFARAPKVLAVLLPFAAAACGSRGGSVVTSPDPQPRVEPRSERPAANPNRAYVAPGASLTIPVMGIRPEQLRDTYEDPRTGHVHHAIDIMAPGGSPVLAGLVKPKE